MKCRRWAICAVAVFGAAVLWWAAGSSLTPPGAADSAAPLWILKDDGGRLAQYCYPIRGQTPVQTWPVYTALLPAADLERLREGIPVYSQQELQRLVEDFGG